MRGLASWNWGIPVSLRPPLRQRLFHPSALLFGIILFFEKEKDQKILREALLLFVYYTGRPGQNQSCFFY